MRYRRIDVVYIKSVIENSIIEQMRKPGIVRDKSNPVSVYREG